MIGSLPESTANAHLLIVRALCEALPWVEQDGTDGLEAQPEVAAWADVVAPDILGPQLTPSNAPRARFSLLFEEFSFPNNSRQSPGDLLTVVEEARLVVRHQINRERPGDSKAIAYDDLDRAVNVLRSNTKTRAWVKVADRRGSRRMVGQTLEQTLRIGIKLSRTVPQAQEA